jgi:hypothetical protein
LQNGVLTCQFEFEERKHFLIDVVHINVNAITFIYHLYFYLFYGTGAVVPHRRTQTVSRFGLWKASPTKVVMVTSINRIWTWATLSILPLPTLDDPICMKYPILALMGKGADKLSVA